MKNNKILIAIMVFLLISSMLIILIQLPSAKAGEESQTGWSYDDNNLKFSSTQGFVFDRNVSHPCVLIGFSIRSEGKIVGFRILLGTYVTGGPARLLASDDLGYTWSVLNNFSDCIEVRSLAYLGGGVVIAGTTIASKIYRSTDYGQTWSLTTTFNGTIDHVWHLLNLGSGVVLAAVGSGDVGDAQIWRSIDDGLTWDLLSRLGETTESRVSANIVNLGNGILLTGTAIDGKIFRSENSGINWTEVYTTLCPRVESLYNMGNGVVLATDALAQNNSHIYRSTDYGLTWSKVCDMPSDCDDSQIYTLGGEAFEPGSILCLASGMKLGGGIYITTDYGVTWSLLQKLPNLEPHNFIKIGNNIILAAQYPGQIYIAKVSYSPITSTTVTPDPTATLVTTTKTSLTTQSASISTPDSNPSTMPSLPTSTPHPTTFLPIVSPFASNSPSVRPYDSMSKNSNLISSLEEAIVTILIFLGLLPYLGIRFKIIKKSNG